MFAQQAAGAGSLSRARPVVAHPGLVLRSRDAQDLLSAVERSDVLHGGCFSSTARGVGLWSGPWRSPGRPGRARHLGLVEWTDGVPARHYISLDRVVVTARRARRQLTPDARLGQVLDLVGITPPRAGLLPNRAGQGLQTPQAS